MHKFLTAAYEFAKLHKFDDSLEYHHCAVIAKGGKILAVGYNYRGWNPLSEQYRTKEHTCTVHAEIAAVLSKRKKIRFEGAKIYVIRIKSDGNVAMSKPCEMCQHVLFNYGIKRAYFSVDNFPFVDKMKIDNPARLP
jgi:deoxycytidylate deaminase